MSHGTWHRLRPETIEFVWRMGERGGREEEGEGEGEGEGWRGCGGEVRWEGGGGGGRESEIVREQCLVVQFSLGLSASPCS